MKTYHVVAAIIRQDDKVLATERGYGEYKDWWEFPGGKIEPGETPEQALKREIHEELAADIAIDRHVTDVSYDYETFHLEMRCFLCTLDHSQVHLLEHEAARWLDANDIESVRWLPADEQVVQAMKEQGIV